MIYCKRGHSKIKGDISSVLAEYTSLTDAMVDALKEKIPEEVSLAMVSQAHKLGMDFHAPQEGIKISDHLCAFLEDLLARVKEAEKETENGDPD